MGRESLHSAEIWALARRQHGVVSRAQLLELGANDDAINHRVSTGRLRRVRRGVYLIGALELSRAGELMAAVLACGDGAALSHLSAGELYETLSRRRGPIDVMVPRARHIVPAGIRIHRRDPRPRTRGRGQR